MKNYFVIPGVEKTNINYENVFRAVEKVTGITKEEICSKARHRPIVEARYIWAYIVRNKTNLTLKKMAEIINKDHCSIIFYMKQMSYFIESDPQIKKFYNKTILLLW